MWCLLVEATNLISMTDLCSVLCMCSFHQMILVWLISPSLIMRRQTHMQVSRLGSVSDLRISAFVLCI